MAPLIDEKPRGTLPRRVRDGWVILAKEDYVAQLIGPGEYRSFMATEGYSENNALSCQADSDWVELGITERCMALARLRSSGAIERVVQAEMSRLAYRSD